MNKPDSHSPGVNSEVVANDVTPNTGASKQSAQNPDSQARKSGAGNSWLKWLLRLGLGLFLIAILIAWQGASVRQALASASWTLLLGAVGFYLLSQILSAWRWQLLFNAATRADYARHNSNSNAESTLAPLPAPLTILECYRIYLIGMFWNLWMPTAIGGDAMRAYLASRRSGNLPLAASSVLADRVTGFVALLCIGAAGVGMQIVERAQQGASSGQALRTLLVALAVLAVFVGLLALARKLAYSLEARMNGENNQGGNIQEQSTPASASGWRNTAGRFWIKLHRSLDSYLSPDTRAALLGAVALSLIFQSSQIVLNIFLARAVGLDLPPTTFLWVIPSLAIASMLPLGIGGLGVREAAAVALLQGLSTSAHPISPGTIIAWSLLWQATLWLSALPGAIAHAISREP